MHDLHVAGFAAPTDRVHFDSGLVRIATFRAAVEHPHFHDPGPIQDTIFVFPRTSVQFQPAGSRPFASGPNVVTFWNRGQVYSRHPIDPAGAHSEYFSVRSDDLLEAIRRLDPAVEDHPDRPFSFTTGPSDAATYLLQRTLFHRLVSGCRTPETLWIEETALLLLDRVLRLAYEAAHRTEAVTPAHRDLAHRLAEELARTFCENRSLAQLAAAVGCSPFYLARVFRRVDGRSIHRYQLQLRLRHALARVAEATDLGRVALDLGFASHSHFTATFRRAFGLAPSRFREVVSPRLFRTSLAAVAAP